MGLPRSMTARLALSENDNGEAARGARRRCLRFKLDHERIEWEGSGILGRFPIRRRGPSADPVLNPLRRAVLYTLASVVDTPTMGNQPNACAVRPRHQHGDARSRSWPRSAATTPVSRITRF